MLLEWDLNFLCVQERNQIILHFLGVGGAVPSAEFGVEHLLSLP